MDTLGAYGQFHFIGREIEVRVLRGGVDSMLAGQGGIYLLAGEPGIGKTRLADEIADYARQKGSEVFWGRCWHGTGGPAYLPWIQIVRECVQREKSSSASKPEGGEFEEIGRIMPELKLAPPLLRESQYLGNIETEDEVRFRAFAAITGLLRKLAERHSLMLILDDLQWADHPSLVLLEYLVREICHDKLFLICICRSVDSRPAGQVGRTFGELLRHEWVQLLHLHGLNRQSVQAFIARELDARSLEELVRVVYQKTDGNPFFVGELVRLLKTKVVDTSSAATAVEVPATVRDVIRRRLETLTDGCRLVVNIASIVGLDFELSAVSAVAEYTPSELLVSLDEARRAGIVSEVDGRVGLYKFSHDLIRDVIYAEVPRSERASLHHQVGTILERLHGGDIEASIARIAYHFFRAAPAGNLRKAVDYSTMAGQQAAESLAYEDAIEHYRRSLEALGCQKADQLERCRILLALGEALNRVGATPEARRVFLQASDLARGVGSVRLLAGAALGYGWDATTGFVDRTLVSLLEESIARLKCEDSALHAHLLSRLARALYWAEAKDRSLILSEQAVDMARRLMDRGAEAIALIAKVTALWGADGIQERRVATEDLERLAGESNEKEIALVAKRFRILNLLEGGEIWELDREIKRHGQLALEMRQPLAGVESRLFRGMRALMDGRFQEVEEQGSHIVSIAAGGQSVLISLSGAVQLFFLRWYQGRAEEVGALLDRMVQDYPGLIVWRCGVAIRQYELGKMLEARRHFERLVTNRFSVFPRDGNWLVGMALLAELCGCLGDTARAKDLYELLAPYEGRNIVIGYGAVCLGAVAHYLGMLSLAMGQPDRAVGHFDRALQGNLEMGAGLLVARTRHEFAKALVARSAPGDMTDGRDYLNGAIAAYRSMGAHGLLRPARELEIQIAAADSCIGVLEEESGAQAKPEGQLEHRDSSESSSVDFLRREGAFWAVSYRGKVSRLKHRKGLEQLAVLLKEPNHEFHVLDVVEAVEGCTRSAVSQNALGFTELGLNIHRMGDAGVVSDARALGQYRERLKDLVSELQEARQRNDVGRVALLHVEVERLSSQMRATQGYRGRLRTMGSIAERARVSIKNNISAVMRDIHGVDIALWRHLSNALKTGTFCCYRSERPIKCE